MLTMINQFPIITIKSQDNPLFINCTRQDILISGSRHLFNDSEDVVTRRPEMPHTNEWEVLVRQEPHYASAGMLKSTSSRKHSAAKAKTALKD